MKTIILKGPRDLVLEERPKPVAQPGWAIVKVRACGICGSDLRYYEGENPWALHTLGYNKPSPPNINLGHEFAGEIVAVGSQEDKHRIGQSVGILAFKICGDCPDCLNDDHNLCENMLHIGHAAGWGERDYYPGGMAEYCEVPVSCCIPIPAGLSFEEAACADFVAVATHAVSLAGDIYNKSVLVFGAGPVGNSVAQIARAKGANVYTVETNATANQILEKLGFANRYSYSKDAMAQLAQAEPEAFWAVWDSVGSSKTILAGMSLLRSKGQLINLATHELEVAMNLTLFSKERSIVSAANNRHEDYPSALQSMAKGHVDAKPFITKRVKLEAVPEAFAMLLQADKSHQFKVIIEPWA